jgi:hypothetical protein
MIDKYTNRYKIYYNRDLFLNKYKKSKYIT